MTPKHGFLFESHDFQAVLFFDPYELCGVEWLTSTVGMDIPKAEAMREMRLGRRVSSSERSRGRRWGAVSMPCLRRPATRQG